MSATAATDTDTDAGLAAIIVVGPRDFTLHRRFMLRVAGLPVDACTALRGPEAPTGPAGRSAPRRTADTARRRAERPADRLVRCHGGRRTGAAVLLALRRQVFNNRLPADPTAALDLAASLGGGTGERTSPTGSTPVPGGRTARRGRTRCSRTGSNGTRAALRELARDDRLRRGLLLASPTLEGRLDAFADGTARLSGKRARKMERSLLSYLYRTACKTSPFSTFTGGRAGGVAACRPGRWRAARTSTSATRGGAARGSTSSR